MVSPALIRMAVDHWAVRPTLSESVAKSATNNGPPASSAFTRAKLPRKSNVSPCASQQVLGAERACARVHAHLLPIGEDAGAASDDGLRAQQGVVTSTKPVRAFTKYWWMSTGLRTTRR